MAQGQGAVQGAKGDLVSHPANPYELPPQEEGDGYTKNSSRWSGGMALGPIRDDCGKEATQSTKTDVAECRCPSAKALETNHRMRYRREARRAPEFIRRWGSI